MLVVVLGERALMSISDGGTMLYWGREDGGLAQGVKR